MEEIKEFYKELLKRDMIEKTPETLLFFERWLDIDEETLSKMQGLRKRKYEEFYERETGIKPEKYKQLPLSYKTALIYYKLRENGFPNIKINPRFCKEDKKFLGFVVYGKPTVEKEPAMPDNTYIPPCIRNLLQGVEEGIRNESCFVIATFFYNRKYPKEKTMEILIDWNERNTPPLPEKEVRYTVESVYRHGYPFGCSILVRPYGVDLTFVCNRSECKYKKREK